jgi:hypothetical protein
VEDKYGTHENHRLIFQESVYISFDLRIGKNDGRKKMMKIENLERALEVLGERASEKKEAVRKMIEAGVP